MVRRVYKRLARADQRQRAAARRAEAPAGASARSRDQWSWGRRRGAAVLTRCGAGSGSRPMRSRTALQRAAHPVAETPTEVSSRENSKKVMVAVLVSFLPAIRFAGSV